MKLRFKEKEKGTVEEKKKRTVKTTPLIQLLIGLILIAVFLLIYDWIVMPDNAISSIMYHYQIRIIDWVLTIVPITRIGMILFIPLLLVIGRYIIPAATYKDVDHGMMSWSYNPFATEKKGNLTGYKKVFSKNIIYYVDNKRINHKGMQVYFSGELKERGTGNLKRLEGKDIEVTLSVYLQKELREIKNRYTGLQQEYDDLYKNYRTLAESRSISSTLKKEGG